MIGIRQLLAGAGLMLLMHQLPAAEARVSDMAALVDAHGAPVLVQILLDARNGQMSIERNGRIEEVWGRPRIDLVTPASLAHDAKKAAMSLEDLQQRLSAQVARKQAEEQRAGSGGAAAAGLPLANLDPGLKVWSPSRTWTVKQLMEDADKYRRGWSDDRNTLRQKQAYRRNRRIEGILLSWQSSYGSADMSEAEKFMLREARNRLNACRGLNKRKNKRQWDEMGCTAATSPSAVRVGRRLKKQLRKPFDDFKAALKGP